jgi:hypothetical protein
MHHTKLWENASKAVLREKIVILNTQESRKRTIKPKIRGKSNIHQREINEGENGGKLELGGGLPTYV